MTAKDKATFLIDQFTQFTPAGEYEHKYAKQCALICIEQNIETVNSIPDIDCSGNVVIDRLRFWNSVKDEINNM